MYLSDRGGIRTDRVTPAIGAVGSARSLRTARSLLIFAAVVATLVGFIALVAIHHARPEIILMLAAAGVWLATLWYVERRSLDRELQQARVRLLDASDRERLRVQRDLHDGAQQRLISVRINLGLLSAASASPDERERLAQLGWELEDALADIPLSREPGRPICSRGSACRRASARPPRRPPYPSGSRPSASAGSMGRSNRVSTTAVSRHSRT